MHGVCFPSTSPRSARSSRPSPPLPPTPPSCNPRTSGIVVDIYIPHKHAKHAECTPVCDPITPRPLRRSIRFFEEFCPQRFTGNEKAPCTGANTRCTGETQGVHMRVFACFGVFNRCQRCAHACFGVFRRVQSVCLVAFALRQHLKCSCAWLCSAHTHRAHACFGVHNHAQNVCKRCTRFVSSRCVRICRAYGGDVVAHTWRTISQTSINTACVLYRQARTHACFECAGRVDACLMRASACHWCR